MTPTTPTPSELGAASSSGLFRRKTPEQESYRILKLREAMARPRSQEWRDNIRAGLKRAADMGKLKGPTPDAIQKTADKLRGRKRPAEVVEKIARLLRGKKRTPEVVQAMRERVLQGIAEGKHKCKDLESRNRRISEALKGRRKGISNPSHAEKMTGFQWSSEVIEARRQSNTGKVRDIQKTPYAAKGPQNRNAVVCEIRSPQNVIYFVQNITDWVRRHYKLFHPDDVLWVKKPGRSPTCRAMKGIMKLRESRDPRGSWKGWTLVSNVEHYTNGDLDLLDRQNGGELSRMAPKGETT